MSDPRLAAARRWWEEGFNARDLGVIRELTAPGFINHAALPGTPDGPEGQAALVQRLWTAFPDGRFTIDHLCLDGDTVVCIGRMSGTHQGELIGIPPTGKAVEWRQCHLVRADADGHALEHSAIRDDLGLMRQMGVMK